MPSNSNGWRHRDQLKAIEASLARQDVDRSKVPNADVLGLHREGPQVSLQLHQLRMALCASALPHGRYGPSQCGDTESFLQQYYEEKRIAPKLFGSGQSGPLEKANASPTGKAPSGPSAWFKKHWSISDSQRPANIHPDNAKNAQTPGGPGPSEFSGNWCMDISNIQGTEAVASDVCFTDGVPSKTDYRHFRIQMKNEPMTSP